MQNLKVPTKEKYEPIVNISSMEIKDQDFFSMSRGKAHTFTKRKATLGYQNSSSNVNTLAPMNDTNANAKEAVRRTLYEIEDNFKLLKHLPNQRLHPFDLNQDELGEIRQFFPEFFPKNLEAKRQTQVKGIDVEQLKALLGKKILIGSDKIEAIIAKLDRKSDNRVTWTEFLSYLDNEGLRREAVNDAQLYGYGVKRLVEKSRHKMVKMHELSDNPKTTEYYIEQLVYIKLPKLNLLLAVFENNQARVYDATHNFKPIQEIEFPFQVMPSRQQKQMTRRSLMQQSPSPNLSNQNTEGRQFSSLQNKVAHDYLDAYVGLEAIQERPVRDRSGNSNKRYGTQGGANTALPTLTRKSLPKLGQLNKSKMVSIQARQSADMLRNNSSEHEEVQYQGHQSIIAYKNQCFVPRSTSTLELRQREKREREMILGLADMSNFYPSTATEGAEKSQREKIQIEDDNNTPLIKFNDFYPGFKQQKLQLEKDFNKMIEEDFNKFITYASARQKAVFDKNLKRERDKGTPEADVIRNVFTKMKFTSEQVGILEGEKQVQQLKESREESNRCAIKLSKLKHEFQQMEGKLEQLTEINKYLPQSQYLIDPLTGQSAEGQGDQAQPLFNKEPIVQEKPSGGIKEVIRKMPVKTHKAVHVSACDYNEQIGLLAMSLIDREVKIYQVKQNGTKISLVEAFSFVVQFPSGGPATCLQIERYVTNGRPIVLLGSALGDIAMYYLDDDKTKRESRGGPTILTRFAFADRGKKLIREADADESDSEIPQPKIRISFRQNERSQYQPAEQPYKNQNQNVKHTKMQQLKNSAPQLKPVQMVTDDYWDSVMMNTREKSKGYDGIKLWNIVYPMVKDYEQAAILIKEVNDFGVLELEKIHLMVKTWIECYRYAGGETEDALVTFRNQVAQHQMPQSASQKQVKVPRKLMSKQPSVELLRVPQSQSPIPPQLRKNPTVPLTDQPNKRRTSLILRQSSLQSNGAIIAKSETIDQDPVKAMSNTSKVATTGLKYMKDIGLIVTTFDGQVKIFDAFNFYLIWRNTNKQRASAQHTTISTFDVSSQLGLMAIAGVEGRIVLIDPYAFGIINQTDAHPGVEVLRVYIYTCQQQIISVAQDRSIYVFDAFRLDKIQMIKDTGLSHVNKFTSVAFDADTGVLFVGDQQINVWQAEVNCQEEIKALQVQTLSKTMMKERNMTELTKLSGNANAQSISSSSEVKNGKVLISKQSQLVCVLINGKDTQSLVITVDSDNLLRGWSLQDCSTAFSYKIPFKSRVTAATADQECKYVAVGTCNGEVAVLNYSSGGLLYNLPRQDKEITCLKFLVGLGEFWLVAGTWGGKMVLWTEPTEDNNYQISAKCRIGHKGDLLCVDRDLNNIVTGGVDGHITVWNQFSGVRKFAFTLPDPIDKNDPMAKHTYTQTQVRKRISDVLFHPFYSNLVCAMQDAGNVHICDISNGSIVADFVAFMKVNSSWACCRRRQRVFVCGDMGKAALFDVRLYQGSTMMEAIQDHIVRRAKRQSVYQGGVLKDFKWKVLCPWFTAHTIRPMDHYFVQSVCYAENADLFVSATSHGEVKLWTNTETMQHLGTINSSEWNSTKVLGYIANPKLAQSKSTDSIQNVLEVHDSDLSEDE